MSAGSKKKASAITVFRCIVHCKLKLKATVYVIYLYMQQSVFLFLVAKKYNDMIK